MNEKKKKNYKIVENFGMVSGLQDVHKTNIIFIGIRENSTMWLRVNYRGRTKVHTGSDSEK